MKPVELVEDDITVRAWRGEDADAVYRACQDPDIQRWTRVPSPYTRDDARHFVADAPRALASGERAPFGVFDTASGTLLGAMALISVDASDVAALGYWTAPWARGRAVAERAGRLVARWAFDKLGVRRLVWEALVGNHPSRLVAARLGFRMEGTTRAGLADRNGQRVDGWVAALLPGELREAGPDDARLRRAARQARTFRAEQPVLRADAPGGPVRLRPVACTDMPDLIEACRDPDMIRYTTIPNPYRPSDAEFFVRYAAGTWQAGTGAVFACASDTGRYLGTMDLRLADWPARTADVGYSVAPWARGRGVGSTALRAVCEWAFQALALDRVEWRAHTGNPASRRVAEKAGFTVEGTEHAKVHHRGSPVDTWYGALLATDLSPAMRGEPP